MKTNTDWPFEEPRNAATFTTTHVMREKEVITHAYHDADDNGWQFHYPGPKEECDVMIVALEEIVHYDPTILEIADLPPGWMAVRTGIGESWRRSRNPRLE